MDKEKLDKFYPLGFLEPEDVADLVVFLLSDMSKNSQGRICIFRQVMRVLQLMVILFKIYK